MFVLVYLFRLFEENFYYIKWNFSWIIGLDGKCCIFDYIEIMLFIGKIRIKLFLVVVWFNFYIYF